MVEVSIGKSLKKAKSVKKEEKNKLSLAFRRKAKSLRYEETTGFLDVPVLTLHSRLQTDFFSDLHPYQRPGVGQHEQLRIERRSKENHPLRLGHFLTRLPSLESGSLPQV